MAMYNETDIPEHLKQYFEPAELGLEKLHDCAGWATGQPCGECYVCRMVEVFRLVRRVLRDDGTVWCNLGDSFAGIWGNYGTRLGNQRERTSERMERKAYEDPQTGFIGLPPTANAPGLKPKDLCMIPARVALALQADGWYLRSDIIWHKPNPMPESVTDRPTKAHEYIFLLSKKQTYYYDAEAVKESNSDGPFWKTHPNGQRNISRTDRLKDRTDGSAPNVWLKDLEPGTGRNRRSVWTVATKPFSGAHFATFPPDLIEPCILAGAPEKCCPKCGEPYTREVERTPMVIRKTDQSAMGEFGRTRSSGTMVTPSSAVTTGWTVGCTCNAGAPVGGVVLDPFGGSGTTGLVARQHGRGFILIEKNSEYVTMIQARLNGTFAQHEAEKAGKPFMRSMFDFTETEVA